MPPARRPSQAFPIFNIQLSIFNSNPHFHDRKVQCANQGLRIHPPRSPLRPALIRILEGYFKHQRKKAVLYFDRAHVGGSPDINSAFLKVHFVRRPAIADEAIIQHLKKLGGDAKNWIVVSSDHLVRRSAVSMGAKILTSAIFAAEIEKETPKKVEQKPAGDDDISQWLEAFGKGVRI